MQKRKSALSLVVAASVLILAAAAYAQSGEISARPPRMLTIKDCIDLAIRNNKSIQIQEEEMDYAKANVLYANSLFMPQADFSVGYTHNDAVALTDSTPRSRKDGRIFFGYKNQQLAQFTVNESIYNGGATMRV